MPCYISKFNEIKETENITNFKNLYKSSSQDFYESGLNVSIIFRLYIENI